VRAAQADRSSDRSAVFNPPVAVRRPAATIVALAALLAAPRALARPVELGLTNPMPAVSCPDNCQAIGRVTGFQAQAGARKRPFQLRRHGKVVAFSITLGTPKPDQVDFFRKLFGGPSRAQLTVLRPGTRERYRVTGTSEVFDLEPYFGSTPSFALSRPLTIKPKYVVALTVPTWAPAFAVGLGNDQAWRSSRNPKHCDDVQQRAAQTTRGSLATYGCLYRTARLLYTVTFVPQPRVTNAPPSAPRGRSSSPSQ
jgi:hypothetical protein